MYSSPGHGVGGGEGESHLLLLKTKLYFLIDQATVKILTLSESSGQTLLSKYN